MGERMKIIGLAGEKHVGKSLVASFFVQSERFVELAFADPLKEALVKLTGLEPKYFYDQNFKEKELPYFISIDHDFLDKLYLIIDDWGILLTQEMKDRIDCFAGTTIKTARELMQTVGTDILRNYIRDDIFIVLLFSRLKEISGDVIITDVRLKNEREALQKAGAKLMRIKRPSLNNKDTHISENDLGKDNEYHVVILNDDISIGQLRSEVLMWYSVAVKSK
jgi:hypothetical protein